MEIAADVSMYNPARLFGDVCWFRKISVLFIILWELIPLKFVDFTKF